MGLRRAGCELHVIAENADWCQVVDEATGECGFMMKKFLLDGSNVIGQEG
jgi:SH3-like domain-containing protein